MTDNVSSEDAEIVILSSVCGKHHDDDCPSCQSAKQSNDDRIANTLDRKPDDVEAVALAIQRVLPIATSTKGFVNEYVLARAVLAAIGKADRKPDDVLRSVLIEIREPTDEMLLAVCDSHKPDDATTDGKRGCSRQVAAASRWRKMIDARLAAIGRAVPEGESELLGYGGINPREPE